MSDQAIVWLLLHCLSGFPEENTDALWVCLGGITKLLSPFNISISFSQLKYPFNIQTLPLLPLFDYFRLVAITEWFYIFYPITDENEHKCYIKFTRNFVSQKMPSPPTLSPARCTRNHGAHDGGDPRGRWRLPARGAERHRGRVRRRGDPRRPTAPTSTAAASWTGAASRWRSPAPSNHKGSNLTRICLFF